MPFRSWVIPTVLSTRLSRNFQSASDNWTDLIVHHTSGWWFSVAFGSKTNTGLGRQDSFLCHSSWGRQKSHQTHSRVYVLACRCSGRWQQLANELKQLISYSASMKSLNVNTEKKFCIKFFDTKKSILLIRSSSWLLKTDINKEFMSAF